MPLSIIFSISCNSPIQLRLFLCRCCIQHYTSPGSRSRPLLPYKTYILPANEKFKNKKVFSEYIAQICTIFEPPTHSSHLLHPSHWGSVLQYSHFLQMRSIKLFFFPSAWVASNTRAMIEQQSNRDLFMLTALFFRCIPRTFSYECCRLSAVFHYRPLQDQTGPVTVTKLQHRPEYLRIFKQFTIDKFVESKISI